MTPSMGRRGQRFSGMDQQPALLLIFIIALLTAMAGRLAWLQLAHGSENRVLADENRVRLVPRSPMRGRLLDRRGRLMAGNRLTYNLYLLPKELNDARWQQLQPRLANLLQIPADRLNHQRQSGLNPDGYRIELIADLKPDQVLRLKEQQVNLQGLQVDQDYRRSYTYGALGAHVLGYTSPITDAEYQYLEEKGYRIQDRIGRIGIEAVYENHLRGEWGGQQLEVNAAGEVQRVLGDKQAKAGKDLTLTLDLDLQRAADEALGTVAKGAIVALDPRTGAVRAMASKPNYDPNIFSRNINTAEWKFLNRTEAPLLNRALQGFPPASTFKIVTTAAGIESGLMNAKSTLPTFNSFCYAGMCYGDHGSFGAIGFPLALAVSSNSFYYQVGLKVGEAELFKAARRFGYGSYTGIELKTEESPGLLGDAAWKKQVLKEAWTPVDTITSAIGQGALQVTPLQMARLYAAVANGGNLVTPHLVEGKHVPKPQGMGLKADTIKMLHQGLRRAVTEGTAKVLADPNLPAVAGKTGTGEDPPRPDHAWFGGYAPAEKPQLVIVAFAENSGGYGGTVSAPMVKKLMEVFFKKMPAQAALTNSGAKPTTWP
ncbi:MAG: penicillin-binding protein 2 [Synechococcus lacustris]|jgi:penicillin-binding protein 2|uniref:penicillin-binding protein 2 n=2 Tax=Synechococcus TaxID=1129 RepID=UPI0009CD5EC2|nr:penicillin-binding protein 2 [Synechococcus lacustris]MCP9924249.1 penicillin-binding protein 2 [Synechococcus lacustris C3-12m-Tous]OON12504.1 MAG: penicillin-binding protein 2 [Synechococcus lacustris str. Tous]HBU26190.1 penicillin-binding protein 2 [Synechococcales bacterium UBA8138]MCF8134009.1 penicillin-binding protein 2 [Synechococcus lacustris]MCP9922014.1 penicillin-binding protein 2 [Synechococcus lacustris Cruz CV12-2]